MPAVCYDESGWLTTTLPVQSLYVHVPFCHTLCGYCDFYSQVLERRSVAPLVDALLTELEAQADACGPVRTIFVGGGTPTVLPPPELRRLLEGLRQAAPRVEEFTVEANPATVTGRVAEVLAGAGVTRVSIGAQSFDPHELRVLDRIHRPGQVEQTVRICRQVGIPQLNLDLIFAIPGQTLRSWTDSLQAALDLRPDHLSCYALTYEPGTPLYDRLKRGQVRRAPDDLEARMYEETIQRLARAGLPQYEISNFARPGCQCRHNLTYWHNEPYLGLGPSAAGFVDGVRYRNVPDTAAYVEAIRQRRSPWIEQEHRSPQDQARETMMLGLRLQAGVDRSRFRERFGRDPLTAFGEVVERHVALGLLEVTGTHIRLTRRGMLLADTVVTDFL